MEIGPPKEESQRHHSSISYKPVQDHDHTLACVRADVYELSAATSESPAKWHLKCSSEPVSLCYDSFRFMYRALCLKGTEIIVNSCIMPDSKISKTAPLFCTWDDDRTKKFLGFGFKQEVLIDTFMKAFEEAKVNMEELLNHMIPLNAKQYQSHSESEPWQPILLNYNVAVQAQPQSDITVHTSEGNRKSSRAKTTNTALKAKSDTSRKVTANSSNEIKKTNTSGSFDIGKALTAEYERRSQQLSTAPIPEVLVLSKENTQLKQFLATNSMKLKELENETEYLMRRNNTMQKSNEVLANNTNSLQMKCDEVEKKLEHWKGLAEKSEQQQKDKVAESDMRKKTQLSNILEQRDIFKNRGEQQQIELSQLHSKEESIISALDDLHAENKAVTMTERKMQDDRILIKKLTEEQLKDSVELKTKIESTLQSLLETSVDIKNSIKKTSFIIEQNDTN